MLSTSIGVEGFEPTTSSTQSSRTTRLCYAPNWPDLSKRFSMRSNLFTEVRNFSVHREVNQQTTRSSACAS